MKYRIILSLLISVIISLIILLDPDKKNNTEHVNIQIPNLPYNLGSDPLAIRYQDVIKNAKKEENDLRDFWEVVYIDEKEECRIIYKFKYKLERTFESVLIDLSERRISEENALEQIRDLKEYTNTIDPFLERIIIDYTIEDPTIKIASINDWIKRLGTPSTISTIQVKEKRDFTFIRFVWEYDQTILCLETSKLGSTLPPYYRVMIHKYDDQFYITRNNKLDVIDNLYIDEEENQHLFELIDYIE
jgi:hypothetical protein